MTHEKNRSNSLENKNKVEELINVVDNYTRTQRHLEQYSDIGDPKNVEHARKIQNVREEEINNLTNKISYGNGRTDTTVNDEINNLEKNYMYAEGYLDHNAEHMPKEDFKNLKEKQENREEKINELKFK
jgi:hypothetical protein